MDKESIKKHLCSGNPTNDLYSVRLKDFNQVVGFFDNVEANNNELNTWKFYLKDNSIDKNIISINGDDILFLDKL